VLGGAVGAEAATYPNPGRVTGDIGVHDPAMMKTGAGGYLLVHTGNNLPIKTSTDRIAFRNAGVVFPNGAPWTTQYTKGSANLWALDISFHNGQYYLYYSASTFGSNNSAIFLATSPTGTSGSWTNQGLVINSTSGSDFNAIDPNLFIDAENQWWLTFGSFWSGITMVRINASTGRRSTTDTAIRALAGRPSSAGNAIEAPFLFRHGNFYYLLVSFDRCCQGARSTYRVMVGRSAAVTGPYLDRTGRAMTSGGGTEILAGHDAIHGPGHQAVMSDVDGELLVYHYYANDNSSKLGINLLGWDLANWPVVR
jgi:arabinan endo-1,5-alpha-L-arabinosidase